MWKIWHDNKDLLSEDENNDFYIREYYKDVLSILNPKDVFYDLNGKTLLCYEGHYKFCHRHIVGAWLELELGIEVLELIDKNVYYKNNDSYKKKLSKYID